MPALVIFGAGNFLGDVFDCALTLGLRLHRLVLNQEETVGPRDRSFRDRLALLADPPRVIGLAEFQPGPDEAYALAPTMPARRALVEELKSRHGLVFQPLIHPTAYVSPLARVGEGCFVGVQATLAPGVVLEPFVVINRAASIGHDTQVGCYARIMPGVHIGGLVAVGPRTMVGIGATVIDRIRLGADSLVAAGAAVTRDVGDRVLVAGVPAQVKKAL
ncbi:MAG: hypothetical protein HQL82_04620 [Magnetococcales bacterium]|nr:hypothetical protein [Magnetococcales bacterium]